MTIDARHASTQPCPCGQVGAKGRGLSVAACCGPALSGKAMPSTAEQLMRSRYTAYTMGDMDYVARTWHPSTRPADLGHDPSTRWLGLEVKSHVTSETGDTAEVSFVARYRVAGKASRMTERSRFVREGEQWLYLDAAALTTR